MQAWSHPLPAWVTRSMAQHRTETCAGDYSGYGHWRRLLTPSLGRITESTSSHPDFMNQAPFQSVHKPRKTAWTHGTVPGMASGPNEGAQTESWLGLRAVVLTGPIALRGLRCLCERDPALPHLLGSVACGYGTSSQGGRQWHEGDRDRLRTDTEPTAGVRSIGPRRAGDRGSLLALEESLPEDGPVPNVFPGVRLRWIPDPAGSALSVGHTRRSARRESPGGSGHRRLWPVTSAKTSEGIAVLPRGRSDLARRIG